MKGKTFENYKNWVDVTERIPNGYYIKAVFEKYYLNKFTSNTIDTSQSVTANYEGEIVQGGYHNGQAYQIPIDKKAEADMFIKSINELMKYIEQEENFYYKMIDNYYRHDIRHKKIMRKLGYGYRRDCENMSDEEFDRFIKSETRRYFRDWDKAVSYFVKEALNRNISV